MVESKCRISLAAALLPIGVGAASVLLALSPRRIPRASPPFAAFAACLRPPVRRRLRCGAGPVCLVEPQFRFSLAAALLAIGVGAEGALCAPPPRHRSRARRRPSPPSRRASDRRSAAASAAARAPWPRGLRFLLQAAAALRACGLGGRRLHACRRPHPPPRPLLPPRPPPRRGLPPRRYLDGNQLSSLAAGVFDKLTALTRL